MSTIVWLENDLRLADHAALHRAAVLGAPIIPVFAWDDGEDAVRGRANERNGEPSANRPGGGVDWADGGATRWWLHHSLVAMKESLARHGLDLVIRRGHPAEVLRAVAEETGARRVLWNARFEPSRHARDLEVAATLREAGLSVSLFAGALIHDPDAIRTDSGTSYQVFTPFWKRIVRDLDVPAPLEIPAFTATHRPDASIPTLQVGDLSLLPRTDWAAGLREAWTPGEDGARRRLETAIRDVVVPYPDRRNFPGIESTSRLSPHLHFGEVSPRQVWHASARAHGMDSEAFRRQVAWREFAFHLLWTHPELPERPLRPAFESFPWETNPDALARWQRGETGFPIVDAGMRELWATGWMHNRVRMIVASFLTKDLLISWREGADWFRDTLVDADLANNTFGWQWTAGCGADAQPFFRVFNPALQGHRYDADGSYVRRWVPEIAGLPDRVLHEPWKATPAELRAAGIKPCITYPAPIVDHERARNRALAAYAALSAP